MSKVPAYVQRDREIVEFFTIRWNEIIDTIEFNPEWETKIPDYKHTSMDSAVYHSDFTSLSYGKVVRSISDHGRRILAVNTRLGAAVIYDHYDGELRTWFAQDLLYLPGITLAIPVSLHQVAGVFGGNPWSKDPNGYYLNLGESLEKAFTIMKGTE